MTFKSPADGANIIVGRKQPDPCPGQAADASVPTYFMRRAGALVANPVPTLIDTGQADGTGVKPPPIGGSWQIPYSAQELVSPQTLADYFTMITHGGTAGPVVTEVGAYGNVQVQDWIYANTDNDIAMSVLMSIPDINPPMNLTLQGTHLSAVTMDAAADAMMMVTTAGNALNFSLHAAAIPEGILAGTHRGPIVAGQPRTDRQGDIYFRVVTVGQETPFLPMTYKVIYKNAGDPAPILADWDPPVIVWEAEYAIDDNGVARGKYKDLFDEGGADLGTKKKGTHHPVITVWEGTIAEHAAELAVGDVYLVKGPITAPVPVAVYGDEDNFTLASFQAFVTLDGEPEREISRESAQILWAHAGSVLFGDSTNFGTRFVRTEQVVLSVLVPYLMEDTDFQRLASTGEEIAARFVIEGRQIGAVSVLPNTPINSVKIELTMPIARVTAATPTYNPTGSIPEARAITSGAGFAIQMRWLE